MTFSLNRALETWLFFTDFFTKWSGCWCRLHFKDGACPPVVPCVMRRHPPVDSVMLTFRRFTSKFDLTFSSIIHTCVCKTTTNLLRVAFTELKFSCKMCCRMFPWHFQSDVWKLRRRKSSDCGVLHIEHLHQKRMLLSHSWRGIEKMSTSTKMGFTESLGASAVGNSLFHSERNRKRWQTV